MSDELPEKARVLGDAPRRKKRSQGATIGIIVSVIFHAGALGYLYNSRFRLKELTYEDQKIDVEIYEPPPPPPLRHPLRRRRTIRRRRLRRCSPVRRPTRRRTLRHLRRCMWRR